MKVASIPPGYRMTELGPLPEEWEVVRLGEVVRWVKGRKPKHFLKISQKGSLPYLTARFFRTGIPEKYVSKVELGELIICDQNDLVMIWDGSKAGQIFTGLKGVLASTMIRLDPVIKTLDRDFLYMFLRTQFKGLNSQTTGTTIPHVSKQLFKTLPIPLPPLPEQKAIAYVLRAVQEAKEKTEEVIKALKELKKSLMKHLFTYGPVPLDEVGRVKLKKTEVGYIPEHWEVVRLGEVVTTSFSGGTPSTKVKEYWTGRIPWTTSAIISEDEVFLKKFQRTISNKGLENSSSKIAPRNSLIVGTRVGVGKAVVATFDIAISQDLTALVLHNSVSPVFMAYLFKLNLIQKKISERTRGTTIKGIPRKDLLSLPIPLPPLHEQERIAEILKAVDDKIEAERKKAEALDTLFKTLLHDLMTARRRLPKDFVRQFEGDGSAVK